MWAINQSSKTGLCIILVAIVSMESTKVYTGSENKFMS